LSRAEIGVNSFFVALLEIENIDRLIGSYLLVSNQLMALSAFYVRSHGSPGSGTGVPEAERGWFQFRK